jgi:hypothetical protein
MLRAILRVIAKFSAARLRGKVIRNLMAIIFRSSMIICAFVLVIPWM